MSPPPCGSSSLSKQYFKGNVPKSLLDIWLQRSAPKDKRQDLYGRMHSDGLKYKLYPNLKEAGSGPRETMLEGWIWIGAFSLITTYVAVQKLVLDW